MHAGSEIELVVTTMRSNNGTTLTVSWLPITLEQARGFFVYRVVLNPVSRSQRDDLSEDVPRNQTSTTFSNLDPEVSYAVTAGVVNENDPNLVGPVSTPLVVNPPTGQLKLMYI